MKEITTETKREVIDTTITYEAVDGKIFDSEEECKKYEKSAEGVLSGKFNKLVVNREYTEYTLFSGSDDNTILALKLNDRQDVDSVLQYLYLKNPYLLKEPYEKYKNEIEDTVNKAYEDKSVLLIGENSEGTLYVIDTVQRIVDKLLAIGK